MVVEDNATTRKMVKIALEAEGYAVVAAGDGASAIDAARNAMPDLVLQDLLLPDMDGFTLVARLRALPGGDAIPILAFTGFVSKVEDARISAAGGALRYATAQRMQQTCVQCHNGHSDSTKKDWKEGEVAGVLEIIRPLDRDAARARDGLRTTFILAGTISLSLLGLTILVLFVGNRRRDAAAPGRADV